MDVPECIDVLQRVVHWNVVSREEKCVERLEKVNFTNRSMSDIFPEFAWINFLYYINAHISGVKNGSKKKSSKEKIE